MWFVETSLTLLKTLSCTHSFVDVGKCFETRASTAVPKPNLLALYSHALAKEL